MLNNEKKVQFYFSAEEINLLLSALYKDLKVYQMLCEELNISEENSFLIKNYDSTCEALLKMDKVELSGVQLHCLTVSYSLYVNKLIDTKINSFYKLDPLYIKLNYLWFKLNYFNPIDLEVNSKYADFKEEFFKLKEL